MLRTGVLAKEDALAPTGLEPIGSESQKRPKKGVSVLSAVGSLPGHPRHRSTAPVRSQGPKAAYKRAAARSTQSKGEAPPWKGICLTSSPNQGSHRAKTL